MAHDPMTGLQFTDVQLLSPTLKSDAPDPVTPGPMLLARQPVVLLTCPPNAHFLPPSQPKIAVKRRRDRRQQQRGMGTEGDSLSEGRGSRRQQWGMGCVWPIRAWQVVVVLALVAAAAPLPILVYLRQCRFMAGAFGPLAFILSPGYSWLPFILLLGIFLP
ncbi:unnamed protein product [Closterium sp. Yama58-4]|nr:unnamed protein product [Closterium sp. Yama58-4]